ncbi:MAG TPA: sugar phosphate isomerase/epimerase family protein [Mycobacteriales bacterium]|nr:sugar phosphate isomerase/epimerase family protein [Mycobacteriales bacterium]
MPISFSTISCPDFTLPQIARAREEHGYDAVELYALEGERLTMNRLADQLTEVRRELRRTPISCINSWAALSSPDPTERRAQEERVTAAVRMAAELGAPVVKAFGGELPADRARSDVLDYMAESISRILPSARRLGVRIVVETHDGFSRGESVGELLARIDDRYFGALWDVHHPYRHGESVSRTAAAIGDRVLHAHVKDAVRDGDGWRFVLLDKGELPVRPMIRALTERGFTGYLSLDWELMWHPEIAAPDVALPWFADRMRSALSRTGEGLQTDAN